MERMLKEMRERIRFMRESHGLSRIYDMVYASGGAFSKSAVFAWESGVREPAISNMYAYAVSFGTTLDGLCGTGGIDYTENTVGLAENFGLDLKKDLPALFPKDGNGKDFPHLRKAIENYLNPKKRKSVWLLRERADIALFVRYLKHMGADREKGVLKQADLKQYEKVKGQLKANLLRVGYYTD